MELKTLGSEIRAGRGPYEKRLISVRDVARAPSCARLWLHRQGATSSVVHLESSVHPVCHQALLPGTLREGAKFAHPYLESNSQTKHAATLKPSSRSRAWKRPPHWLKKEHFPNCVVFHVTPHLPNCNRSHQRKCHLDLLWFRQCPLP